MKKRRDRQEKLHDSLINMLYAPPSSSPSPPEPHDLTQFDEQTLDLAREIVTSDHHRINTYEFEEEEGRSEEEEEEGELGSEKLTRAQRKRLRKKKLKEVASNRRQIIGPQLPSTGDDQIDGDDGPEHQHSEGVRRNVTEGSEGGNDHNFREEAPSTIKVKHRRMSKKKARDKTMTTDNLCHEATSHDHQN